MRHAMPDAETARFVFARPSSASPPSRMMPRVLVSSCPRVLRQVIISDAMSLPFEHLIPWDEIVVRIPESVALPPAREKAQRLNKQNDLQPRAFPG